MEAAPITEVMSINSQERKSESQGKARNSKSAQLSIQKTISPSRKSVSGSKSSAKHKLRRTLKRKPAYHQITSSDLKYLWAAYKRGSFADIPEMDQDQFNAEIERYLSLTDRTYVMSAKTGNGFIPIGIASGNFNGPLFFLGNALWFEWASDRNKLEASVNLLNDMRKDYICIMHNHMGNKKFYETIASHGVIRQVGRIFDVYEDCPAQVWQTRKR